MDRPPKKHPKRGPRFFSFDSTKSSDSAQYVSSPDDTSPFTGEPLREYTSSPRAGSSLQLLKEEELVPATKLDSETYDQPRSGSPFGFRAAFRAGASTKVQPPSKRPASEKSSYSSSPSRKDSRQRSFSSDAPPSARSSSPSFLSRAPRGWDLLRQRVLLSGANSLTPTSASSQLQEQPSPASSLFSAFPAPSPSPAALASPARSPTPKLFARLGFRQIVDGAREAAAVDESLKLSEAIQKAVWSSRSTDPSKPLKPPHERETVGSFGSTLHLPFMSGSYMLPPSVNVSVVSLPALSGRRHELRRHPSIQSLNASSGSSVNHLLQTLLHHAPTSTDLHLPIYLPHESQVHSALLVPFLTQETGAKVEEERRIAIEAFEVVVKTWKAETKEIGVDRCLWCCKAASPLSTFRMRILGVLWSTLLPRDSRFEADTPATLQTLIQGLFLLRQSLSTQAGDDREDAMVRQLVSQIRGGVCGEIDRVSLKEEYGVGASRKDDDQRVREALISEGLSRCLENGVEGSRRWILRNLVEEYWPEPPQSWSLPPLLKVIHTRKLDVFARAAVTLLLDKSSEHSTQRDDAEVIVRVLQTRVFPELEAIHGRDTAETRGYVAYLVLQLFGIYDAPELSSWVSSLVCRWYEEVPAWKLPFESALQRLIFSGDWPLSIRIVSALIQLLPGGVCKPVITFALPHLFDQLTTNPPAYPCLRLTELLEFISRSYPPLFYKPLISCAASTKDVTVANHLCIISALSRFLPDFWTRDAEMMSIALMSDAADKGKSKHSTLPNWGKARLGQSILLLELAGHIKSLRHSKESSSNSEAVHAGAAKFSAALESRLAILLEAKEARTRVPISQRLIICVLFLQVRLFTRSLKSAPWLSRVISWLLEYYDDSNTLQFDEQLLESTNTLRELYNMAQQSARSSRKSRGTLLLSPTADKFAFDSAAPNACLSVVFKETIQLIGSLSKGFPARVLELLVALSGILTSDHYRRLGPILWDECLESHDARVIAPGCFLTMKCVEKIPADFLIMIKNNILSADPSSNLQAIRRMSALSNWRFQIMSQHVIVDRTHRGPFKLARDPLPFVATDVGSGSYVRDELSHGRNNSLPLELRKRLLEVGWADENDPVDQLDEWIRTPMSLLPVLQMDSLHGGSDETLHSPSSPIANSVPSPTKTNGPSDAHDLARKSSFGTPHGSKRRAVFVPGLATLFPTLALLVFNTDVNVATAARTVMMDFMRNDPALLARPIFDLFCDDRKDIASAISAIRAFLHVRRALPPAMAHNLFNSLAGYLKHASKQLDSHDAFHEFAQIVPAMAKLVTHVSGTSIRDLRRAKIEAFVIPSGSLWFPSSAPAGPMFPRTQGASGNPFRAIPARLVSMIIIRASQNMFFLDMLRQNPHDVQLIRKNISRLVLPSWESGQETGPLELKDFVPSRKRSLGALDAGLRSLSLLLSRSYLLLVAQIFRSMSRHLSDRNELAVLIDGLNRILLVHGNDIGIVAQAMIALMVASTRFRRLFASGGGFTLFMPVLVKIYAESESQSGVREAIIYTIHRFFAQHYENFVFQSLDIMSHVVTLPGIDGGWIAENIYSLFSSLRTGILPVGSDAAGIHNSNKVEERDALIVSTVEEKPQAFLASLRQGDKNGKGITFVPLPEEYESRRLRPDNFVRLFLTVIAYDTTILRAEQFLRLFHFLAPYLYEDPLARLALGDGIDALGMVITRAPGKTKAPEALLARPSGDVGLGFQPSENVIENSSRDKFKSPSNPNSMRIDYLSLVVAFIRSGGQIRTATSRRTIELVKAMLRDSSFSSYVEIASFFAGFAKASLVRLDLPSVKDVVTLVDDLTPVINAYAIIVDFSGVFDAVSHLISNPVFANEPLFCQRVVARLCAAGLGACEQASSAKVLSTSPLRRTLVSFMTKAVFLHGVDVIGEVEKCIPSYDFLAFVVFPFIVSLRPTVNDDPEALRMEARHRDVLARAWMRLLSYTMSACYRGLSAQKAPRFPERTKIQDKRRPSPSAPSDSQIKVLVIAAQIVKIIIVQADNDLSSSLRGIWSIVAVFFKSLLADGNGRFALQPQEHYTPAPASPTLSSPILSPGSNSSGLGLGFTSLPSTEFETSSHKKSLPSPRMVDYSLWSLFELLCQIRNPLFIQLRLFIREKVVDLDQALHAQQNYLNAAAFAIPSSRRVSTSSIFSKPRRRMSTMPPLDSPETRVDDQQFPRDYTPPSSAQPVFFPGSSPTKAEFSGHKVVHLGPALSPTRSIFSIDAGGGRGGVGVLSKLLTVRSHTLVRATYRRIHLVQSCLGYESRPAPIQDDEWQDMDMTTWTKKQALDAVVKETMELLDEFKEWSKTENDGGIVDPDQSIVV